MEEEITYESPGKKDIYGDFDTGGPEEEDFNPLTKEIQENNLWSIFDLIKKITYCESEEVIISEEEQEEPDYLEISEQHDGIYLGLDTEEEELIQDKYVIKQDEEDIIPLLKKEIEEEPDYEEDNIIQFPEHSLEEEVRKAA